MLPENVIIEDFVQSLLLCQKGFVVKYEPSAYSLETASLSLHEEMERKIRISAGGFQAMALLKNLFNIFRYPLVSFQFISHRVLRWTLCPLSLIALFISTWGLFGLIGDTKWAVFGLLQGVFYFFAVLGYWLALQNKRNPAFYLPFYFAFMNFCVFAGFWRHMTKRQEAIWKKAARA